MDGTVFLVVVHVDYGDVLDEVRLSIFLCLWRLGSAWLLGKYLDGTLL